MTDRDAPPADQQLELAQQRTVAAHTRTILAEQRTFSAWIRTGLAGVATGFAIVKLVPQGEPKWLIRVLGVLFIAAGGAMFALGYATYYRAVAATDDDVKAGLPRWLLGAISGVLLAGAAAALVLIFLE